jgi:hypothetical protein
LDAVADCRCLEGEAANGTQTQRRGTHHALVGWRVPARLGTGRPAHARRSHSASWRTQWPAQSSAILMKLGPSESQLHISVAEFLDWILLPPAMYTTFPAGWGQLGFKTSNQLKRSGLKPGMPDIMVLYDSHCFFIELKAGKNTLSPVQREMHSKLRDAGVHVYVAKSIEDVVTVLVHERVPMRPTGGQKWKRSTLPLERGGDYGTTQTATDGAGSGIA